MLIGQFFQFRGISDSHDRLAPSRIKSLGRFLLADLPLVVQGSGKTDERSDTCNGGNEQVIRTFPGKIESEIPFGGFS